MQRRVWRGCGGPEKGAEEGMECTKVETMQKRAQREARRRVQGKLCRRIGESGGARDMQQAKQQNVSAFTTRLMSEQG